MVLVVAVLVVALLVALAVVVLVVAGLVVGLRASRLLINLGGSALDLVRGLLLIVFGLLTLIIGAGGGRLRRRARRGGRRRVAGERSGDSGAREQRQGGHGDDQLPWVHPGSPFVPGARLRPRFGARAGSRQRGPESAASTRRRWSLRVDHGRLAARC